MEGVLSQNPQKERSLADTLVLAQGDPLQTSDLQTSKENKFALFTAAEFVVIYTTLDMYRFLKKGIRLWAEGNGMTRSEFLS